MGLFNNLMSKIFSHGSTASGAATAGPASSGASAGGTQATGAQGSGSTGVGQTSTPSASAVQGGVGSAPPVDVAAILDDLAAKNPEKLDWKHSIVDLMKLVGMDSGLSARKQLATELHFTGDQNDSAAMNIWLHKQVLRKLAENGGKVPQELLK